MAVPAVRTLAFALRMALRRILHGVYINTAGLKEVGGCKGTMGWLPGTFFIMHNARIH